MRGDRVVSPSRGCAVQTAPVTENTKQDSLRPPTLPPLPTAALLVLLQHPLHQTCLSSHSPCYPQPCCCPTWWGGRPCWSSLDPRPPGQAKPLSGAV